MPEEVVLRLRADNAAMVSAMRGASEESSKFGGLWEQINKRFVITAGDMIGAAKAIGRGLRDLMIEGGRYGDVMAASVLDIDAAAAATKGLVSNMSLAEKANAAMEAGLVLSQHQFESLAKAATIMGQRTGKDSAQAFDQLLSSVVAAESRGLKQFGIALDSVSGKLSAEQQLLARQTQAVEKFTAKYGDAEVAVDDAGEVIEQTEIRWQNFTHELGRALAESSSVNAGLQHLHGTLVTGISVLDDAAEQWGFLFRESTRAAQARERYILTERLALAVTGGDTAEVKRLTAALHEMDVQTQVSESGLSEWTRQLGKGGESARGGGVAIGALAREAEELAGKATPTELVKHMSDLADKARDAERAFRDASEVIQTSLLEINSIALGASGQAEVEALMASADFMDWLAPSDKTIERVNRWAEGQVEIGAAMRKRADAEIQIEEIRARTAENVAALGMGPVEQAEAEFVLAEAEVARADAEMRGVVVSEQAIARRVSAEERLSAATVRRQAAMRDAARAEQMYGAALLQAAVSGAAAAAVQSRSLGEFLENFGGFLIAQGAGVLAQAGVAAIPIIGELLYGPTAKAIAVQGAAAGLMMMGAGGAMLGGGASAGRGSGASAGGGGGGVSTSVGGPGGVTTFGPPGDGGGGGTTTIINNNFDLPAVGRARDLEDAREINRWQEEARREDGN